MLRKSQENIATVITADASMDMASQKFTEASVSFRWNMEEPNQSKPEQTDHKLYWEYRTTLSNGRNEEYLCRSWDYKLSGLGRSP